MQPLRTHKPFTALIFLRDVALGLFLWLVLTTAIGEARVVPSGSMAPTIAIGDRVWTDKIAFRFKGLQRGDIVIFDPPFMAEDQYVKRVVGLPGEVVEISRGTVWVNGTALDEPYIAEEPDYRYGPVQIPGGHYLVLGDNRNVSHDSHTWGLLSRDRITARVVWRIWPVVRAGRLEN